MTTENGLTAADVGAVVNGGRYGGMGGFGNTGFGGDGAWWLLILFLFAFMGNWGNNGNNGGYGNTQFVPWMMGNQSGVQQGFDQAAVMGGLNGIQQAIANGFGNAEVSRCNAQANILQTLNANQNAVTSNMNSLAMGLQNCCCENRAGLADLKYTVATENCADRAAVSDGIRDVIAAGNANTQAILDKLCALELDGVKQRNADLLAENSALKFANSQTAQTAAIEASQAAQTATLLNRIAPAPIPAYVVQNPGCCNNGWGNGCGCNG